LYAASMSCFKVTFVASSLPLGKVFMSMGCLGSATRIDAASKTGAGAAG
jgi:hypothetical protein